MSEVHVCHLAYSNHACFSISKDTRLEKLVPIVGDPFSLGIPHRFITPWYKRLPKWLHDDYLAIPTP
jgi:hypothetical protein